MIMTDIVKVQVPIFTNDPQAQALIYAKDGRHLVQQSLDYQTVVALNGDLKAYFHAEFIPSTGKWSIGERVQDRDW